MTLMDEPARSLKVMIAGVGGASLGTEVFKALRLAGGYEVFGCDVSSTAYGLYDPGFSRTYRVSLDDYVASVIDACMDAGAKWLIPGGEQPTHLLGGASQRLADSGIQLVGNAPQVVAVCSDKDATFRWLAEHGIAIPRTVALERSTQLDHVGLPCVVKPATNSGGSASVFFAVSADEAMIYAEFIRRSGGRPIAQEYVDIGEGEFTVGVLSLPDRRTVGAIALRRDLNAKLSVAYRGRGGIISSGYSQGHIGEYPAVCRQAERIAETIGSCGPINIQGRVRGGTLLPFEINPRFSASTYLRAMAGFNEADIMLRHLAVGAEPQRPAIVPGWYLRSLTEQYVPADGLR
jgi:carbamoyl-phosphate synthase large subunit